MEEKEMRKSYFLVVFLVVLSMLFAACTTPTQAPQATEPPVTEPEATEPPAVEEPVATEPPVVEEPTEEAVLNQYLGSNMLDGNGTPPTFFDDVHIRKAFAYCFDWDTLINDVYRGEAIQSKVLSLPGMPGYDPNAPFYSFDLDKCAEEFKLADVDKDGVAAGEDPDDVWEMGFRLQMLYNTGNTVRQIIAEILQANLAEVNEKFLVEVLGLPWPSYLQSQRAHKIPIMTGGWLEDIHDAHNWYQPYTTGTYGARQNMPDDLKAQFKDLLDQGVSLVDPAERDVVYKQFNQLYYDSIPGYPLVLATSHAYEQKWVEGRVMNPLYCNIVYQSISKTGSADPTTFTSVTTGDAITLDPATSYDTASCEVIQNVYETLVFYDGEATDKFVPQLAEEWTTSDDGTVWTFQIRDGVTFHDGAELTASDVAYSFQRGLLKGGYSTPQWLLAEPFLGVGMDDITMIVDEGASADDKEALIANDPAVLKAACETVTSAIVADDAAGTVTFTLAQAWGPFLATIANAWGSIMDKDWTIANGGWDGSCDTWQNFYAPTDDENPLTLVVPNGTGPFKLDHWTQGEEWVVVKNENYWGEPAKLDRVVNKIITEFGTRFAMLQAGEADIITVPADYRVQVDPMVSEMRVYDEATNTYLPAVPVCEVDTALLGQARFTVCDAPSDQPLRLYIGRPGLSQDVILFTFLIQ
jgi:ABC-type transport system substrate-binding protein